MTLHKLFKEMVQLSKYDQRLLADSLDIYRQCKAQCNDLGVKFSEKRFESFISKTFHFRCFPTPIPGAPTQKNPTQEEIKQVVLGTNLDKIEEAAEKKGLI